MENKLKSTVKEILSTSLYLLFVLLLTYLIIHFVGQRTVVNGSSMEDTLSDGDNLIVDKISYRFNDIERYDVVVFPHESNKQKNIFFIKRVIGLPGETVQIDNNGTIYINGEILEEHYGNAVIQDPGRASSPIVLGPNEYFVMGDNRNNSLDSRSESVGNISKSIIIGKAWVRVWPISKAGKVDNIK